MNRLVCQGLGGTWHLTPEKISLLQEDCQDRLLRSVPSTPSSQRHAESLSHLYIFIYIKPLVSTLLTQAVHQVTAEGSGHSVVLPEAREMEPGRVDHSAASLLESFQNWLCHTPRCLCGVQVDPALKMDIVEPEGKRARGVLFQLHPITVLNSWKAQILALVL